jgi:hypothetical protein
MRTALASVGTFLRQGLPALAVYALVLQAFLAGATPASALQLANAPLCAELVEGSHTPQSGDAHADCICLAQCLQSHAQATSTPETLLAPLWRLAISFEHSVRDDASSSLHPLERGPGARAPPQG